MKTEEDKKKPRKGIQTWYNDLKQHWDSDFLKGNFSFIEGNLLKNEHFFFLNIKSILSFSSLVIAEISFIKELGHIG